MDLRLRELREMLAKSSGNKAVRGKPKFSAPLVTILQSTSHNPWPTSINLKVSEIISSLLSVVISYNRRKDQ
jgi:hypothetical protein